MHKTSLSASLTPRARFAHARATIASTLRKDDGIEVSIPNIIVAIVVSLVVIGSVIAGIVFVVPFAQDSTAKSDLQTVQSAQQVYYSQTAPPAYGTAAQLVAKGSILKSGAQVAIVAAGDKWCAGVRSDAGHNFWLYAGTTEVQSTIPTPTEAGITCPSVATIAASTGIK
jgi:type II secretory pathway pseudopilin PulG